MANEQYLMATTRYIFMGGMMMMIMMSALY